MSPGCNSEYVRKSSKDISDGSVTFTLKENTLSVSGATFVLKNYSKDDIMYGRAFSIEQEVNNEWYELKTINDLVFTMEGYILKPTETKEIEINWEYWYGELSPGKYRLVKNLSIEYEDDTRDSFDVAGEFEI